MHATSGIMWRPDGDQIHHACNKWNYVLTAFCLLLLQAMQVLDHSSGARPPPDPRSAVNLYGLTPAQLAGHMRNRVMVRLLMPGVPITDLFTRAEVNSLR
jgi:hypothetical protein